MRQQLQRESILAALLAWSLAVAVHATEPVDLWSFQPLVSDVPTGEFAGIDAFLQQTLLDKNLRFSPPADRRTLIRRATFDLTGLPPAASEIDAFVADDSPDASQRLVDRLLASPHYGERWGRHWLDLVRYADTSGNSGDFPVPTAWLYRNYVIDAWNADRPYDRFVREQVAGDLLPSNSLEERHRNIIATGYLAISRRFGVEEKQFHLTIEDTITNLGTAFLSLSVHCARCHDHKFDPVTNKDYYALYGILQSTRYAFPGTEVFQSPKDFVPLVSAQEMETMIRPFERKVKEQDTEIERLRQLTLTIPPGAKRDQAVVEYQKAQQARIVLLESAPRYLKAYAVSEAQPVNAKIHIQGNPNDLGAEVPRGFLSAFGAGGTLSNATDSGRLPLADWLTSPRVQPLLARVIVNRIWQHHFGAGLVRTPNDFGTRGERPTHPKLLDYLAHGLIHHQWSIKWLHRRILASQAYRQDGDSRLDSETRQQSVEIDPNNLFLWKFPRRRLSAEELRDTILLFSGQLDRTPGQGHAFPPEYEWKFGQHTPYIGTLKSKRRSVYLMRQRVKRHPFLATFDAADPNVATGQRVESTTALQALWLMNNPDFHALATASAQRLLSTTRQLSDVVQRAHIALTSHPADEADLQAAIAYIRQCAVRDRGADSGRQQERAVASYVRVLMSSNVVLYVE